MAGHVTEGSYQLSLTFRRFQSKSEFSTFITSSPELIFRMRLSALMHSSALCCTWETQMGQNRGMNWELWGICWLCWPAVHLAWYCTSVAGTVSPYKLKTGCVKQKPEKFCSTWNLDFGGPKMLKLLCRSSTHTGICPYNTGQKPSTPALSLLTEEVQGCAEAYVTQPQEGLTCASSSCSLW